MQTTQTKALLIATLVVPLLLISCSRSDPDQTALPSGTTSERQGMTPADPAKTLESSPPAAGIPPATTTPPMESAPSATPATPPSEPPKSGY